MRNVKVTCQNSQCTETDCPLRTMDVKRLCKEPCCSSLWIPARFLSAAAKKGEPGTSRAKAARLYLEWVMGDAGV